MKTLMTVVQEEGKLVLLSPDLHFGAQVRVTIEPTEVESAEARDRWLRLLHEIETHKRERPQDFRTPEQIDADIKAEREAWD